MITNFSLMRWLVLIESLILVLTAFALATCCWLLIAAAGGMEPLAVIVVTFQGAFGSSFAWQQTLRAATPILLTGLAVALPAKAGLLVVGCEGAFVLAGLAAAVCAITVPTSFSLLVLFVVAIFVGALWLGIGGWLRVKYGVHEAVSGFLLTYMAIALLNQVVVGSLRDPNSYDKPATRVIPVEATLETMEGIHLGLPVGILACIAAHFLITKTRWGFAIRVGGENPRAAVFANMNRRHKVVIVCLMGGALAGLAAAFEVAAIQERASASLALGYGYVGILVAMLARGNMLAVIPSALLVGALDAGGGLLQRRLDAPAASAELMHGLLFVSIMVCAALQGRLLPWWQEKLQRRE